MKRVGTVIETFRRKCEHITKNVTVCNECSSKTPWTDPYPWLWPWTWAWNLSIAHDVGFVLVSFSVTLKCTSEVLNVDIIQHFTFKLWLWPWPWVRNQCLNNGTLAHLPYFSVKYFNVTLLFFVVVQRRYLTADPGLWPWPHVWE